MFMPKATEETAWVQAAKNGDRAAFGRLHSQYRRMVHGILLARVHAADADDLAQEVFIKAMDKLDSLRQDASFGPWLAQLARNQAYEHHRTRRTVVPLFEELPQPTSLSEEEQCDARRILEAIKHLPETYRETLILRLAEGLTGPEIAECMGMTHGSVRVHLHRGMQLLRAALGWKESEA